ncbi:MAG: hypothetical protein JO001_12610 [Alphaproteobacteria bacterium]|nr:hypothetical protein [Alphaproteobacteria bacterium]
MIGALPILSLPGSFDYARRLMLTVLGGLAEFERELIRTRTGDCMGICLRQHGTRQLHCC